MNYILYKLFPDSSKKQVIPLIDILFSKIVTRVFVDDTYIYCRLERV